MFCSGIQIFWLAVTRNDADSFGTKNVRDQSGGFTTETSSSGFVQTKTVQEEPGKEWTPSTRDESDSVTRRDEWEERSLIQTGVITTTETSSSETFGRKNVREEPGTQWSQRIHDESDSAFRKYRTDGGDHGSATEESWTVTSGRLTQRDTSSTLRVSESAKRSLSPSSLYGGVRCQAVDSEQLNVCSHEEK